jgi:hypothetical protein
MLRIPPGCREQLRHLAARNDTSAGGAVMILLKVIDDIHELAASNTNSTDSVTKVLGALLGAILPPAGLKSIR